MMTAARIGVTAALALWCADLANAENINVYCTGAPSQAIKAIAAGFSARTGHHFTFTVGQPATIEADLAAGGKADIIVVPAPDIDKLNQSGALRATSVIDLARVGIGVVVRTGAPRPDISSTAAIRKLLVQAHSIAYPNPNSGGGSTGRHIARMIEQMGLSEAVKGKVTRVAAIGGGVDLVAKGKAEIGLFNISEVVPVHGVKLVGPLPDELQNYIVFDAAIASNTMAALPAAEFIRTLTKPAQSRVWRKAGLEPLAARQPQ